MFLLLPEYLVSILPKSRYLDGLLFCALLGMVLKLQCFKLIIRLSAKGTNGVMKPVGFRTFLEFVILSTERSVYYRTRGGEWRGCIAATPHVYMVRSSVKASTIGANK